MLRRTSLRRYGVTCGTARVNFIFHIAIAATKHPDQFLRPFFVHECVIISKFDEWAIPDFEYRIQFKFDLRNGLQFIGANSTRGSAEGAVMRTAARGL
ncbi:MAG: hypothetical protein COT74_10735 [Bdellovibrionales bacterium CG10_big_fil_rev_8_21_14_0_10_45_34]|nr:MAG: hypothetical protein COT74_10735 [Bdellovibrionales bacterium CG10_big_fil_rev_8_21_14_0_10_45_34]